ncbi:hypothetical protein SCP_1200500 [Sparassis crispa]|uniref:C2H2-type domain-containing protein n=1 Tax=Sparassis crispa TaxID=139825 RepID=A0A401H074_9APHY|nr:hypothetical protein SCP_1200500 [Sparassis crispa]GBE87825.1 hypothetical protein SCP_1200500 [Sparassis crispa]
MEYSHRLSACLQALDSEAPFDVPPYASMYSEGPISFGVTSSPAPHGSPDSTMSSDSVDIGASFAFYTPSVVSAGSMLGLMTSSGSSLTMPVVPNYLGNDIFGNLDSTSPRGRPFVGDTFLDQPIDGYDSFLGSPSRLGGRIHSPYSPSLSTSDHHHGGADDYHDAHNRPPSPSNISASFSEHSSVTSPAEVLSPIPALSLPPLPVTHASRAKAANAIFQQQVLDTQQITEGESDDSESGDEYVPSRAGPSRARPSRAKPSRPAPARRQGARTRRYAPYARAVSPTVPSPSSQPQPQPQFERATPRNEQFDGEVRPPSPGATQCKYCPASYKRWCDLDRHVRSHDGNARRTLCGGLPKAEAISAGVNVKAEMPYVYDGVEYYGGCMKEFSRKDSLSRHLQRSKCRVGSLTTQYNLERARRL